MSAMTLSAMTMSATKLLAEATSAIDHNGPASLTLFVRCLYATRVAKRIVGTTRVLALTITSEARSILSKVQPETSLLASLSKLGASSACVLHGLGAETPSQLMLFLLTASLGGTAKGFLGLGAFAFGLVAMNTLMTASLGGIFGAGKQHPLLCRGVAWAGAVYSVALGVVFLVGSSAKLPAMV